MAHATAPAEKPRKRPIAETSKRPIAETAAVTAGKNGHAGEVLSARWPPQEVSIRSIERVLAMSSSGADEDSTTDPAADMPLIWPILTAAELGANAPSSDPILTPQHMPLLFVGALALAAFVGRAITTTVSRM